MVTLSTDNAVENTTGSQIPVPKNLEMQDFNDWKSLEQSVAVLYFIHR